MLAPRKSVSRKEYSPTESFLDTKFGFPLMTTRTLENAQTKYPPLPTTHEYMNISSKLIDMQPGPNADPSHIDTNRNQANQLISKFPSPPSRTDSYYSRYNPTTASQTSVTTVDINSPPLIPRNPSLNSIIVPPKPYPRVPSSSNQETQALTPLVRNNTSTAHSVIGNYGMVGLKNIGNSCYMNSIIQCLNATTPLSRYFSTENFKRHVNTRSKLGSGGAVVGAYANLVKAIWSYKDPVLTPRRFKVKELNLF